MCIHCRVHYVAHCTVLDTMNCTINNKQPFVTYVPPTCFDFYKVIIREIYKKTYKYSKFYQRCACVELKYNSVNENYYKCLKYKSINKFFFRNSEQYFIVLCRNTSMSVIVCMCVCVPWRSAGAQCTGSNTV